MLTSSVSMPPRRLRRDRLLAVLLLFAVPVAIAFPFPVGPGARRGGLDLGVLPLHGAGVPHRGDPEDDLAVLEEPDSAVGLADDEGQGLGHRGDRRGGPV